MSQVKSVIQNMSDEVRARAEAFARGKGISLEVAVATQMSVVLTERELATVAGGIGRDQTIEESGPEEYVDS